VRIEMMKERAQVLKDQEERLGAMVASLQMSKAREVRQRRKIVNTFTSKNKYHTVGTVPKSK
jgi:hypothetical protein